MAGLKLQPKRKERLGDQLYGQILEQIVSGTLKEGDKLPSEKELCLMFEVSRPVVREAMMLLQADGLVVARQGSGTYVQRRPPQGLIALGSASDVAGMLRCYELRVPLEGEAAALAAKRRTPEQLAQIKAALDELARAFETRTSASAADFAFHRAVAEASCNDLFVSILETLHGAVENSMAVALNITAQGSAERSRRVLDEHGRIYEAIAMGDAEAANLAMRYHINRARQRITDQQQDV
ncbi:DNA-binding FadR family transcriptional regulator [Azospirillum agricola]|uniref:FadR/GntR family transcriptional regulator n=1 Tax=Azospirillum agricola TaxID=1720247 RepID=UPI001AE647EA|nr:FadR/GntR family transcriptional regulator [Azospirillum agricola]MBP2229578.1 DNA-binding FadR family transcriptional regulator [Azospirillum agricola]